MARTKNRGLQQSFSPSYTVRRWRLGAYIRLSKEDLKKGKDDSNSVINQRDLLNDFYQKHIGEFESVSEYVDDGHTGTDANRENFQRLLSDVMSGKINCVVVKDLSRFARNYSDAGSTCCLSVKNSASTLFRVSSCWMISSPSFSLWAPAVRRLWGGIFLK